MTLAEHFETAGCIPLSLPHLFPAETLLELYGEDLRSRAFLFPGSGIGEELALRPDFTIPVVLEHASLGWPAARRYSYQGPVFRRQEPGSARPFEYLQAGIECIGTDRRPETDSEVLKLILSGLEALGVKDGITITTGDLGIPFALLDALEMPPQRRETLRRHFWRPERFHALIAEAVAGQTPPSPLRQELLRSAGNLIAVEQLAASKGEIIGARDVTEIVERARALAALSDLPPMPGEQAGLIEEVLDIRADPETALRALRDLAQSASVDIANALDRLERRLEAIARSGIDTRALVFDASFGRSLEYYDGFVFEIVVTERTDLPPLAGGGRYYMMTERLGASRPVPAAGGMIRPEAVLSFLEASR